MHSTFQDYAEQLAEFLRQALPPGGRGNVAASFNQLALGLFARQYEHVPAYHRLCEHQRVRPEALTHWTQVPAVPTRAFKELAWTSLAPGERETVFHSSGTGGGRPSRHFHSAASLRLYETSLLPWFRAHAPAGPVERWDMLFLTPAPELAPHSSLVHMLETVRRKWGTGMADYAGNLDAHGAWTVDFQRVLSVLAGAERAAAPLAILGTAYAFVTVLDRLVAEGMCAALPPGSWAMETGGYKGRSRSLAKTELYRLMNQRLGLPRTHVVSEYGMSELSSQAYDHRAGEAEDRPPRRFRFPPWARAVVISPETGTPVEEGQTGLVRVLDLANVASVLAVQTEDLAIRHGEDFELVGRVALAEPRGCSLLAAEPRGVARVYDRSA
jgi:hypothetical protein